MSIYQEITKAGIPHDHHESDLYFLATPEAREIMRRLKMVNTTGKRGTKTPDGNGWRFDFFVANDGRVWVDVPFAYEPWWEQHRTKAETRVVDRLLRDIRDPSP